MQLLETNSRTSAAEFDLVNLTRQFISNRFEFIFAEYKKAYDERDRATMAEKKAALLDTFDKMEELLSTQTYFLLGRWIADARALGVDEAEKAQLPA